MVKAPVGIALCFLLASASARAQLPSFLSCIDQTQSWTQPFNQGQISSVTYVVSMPFAPAPPVVLIRLRQNQSTIGWLIGINGPVDDPAYHPTGPVRNVNILISFPSNLASQYQRLTNADSTFASQRRSKNELLLLDGGSFCPLLAEDTPYSTTGYPIWSH